MRHRKSGRKLGRTKSHRKATLANLATALFENKKIKTTTAKAKEARSLVERLISFAKRGDLSARRHVLKTVKNKTIVKTLFDEIAPKYVDRNGGYTRIIKLGQRPGDGAALSILELVGYEGVQKEKKEKGEKTGPKATKGLRDKLTRRKQAKETTDQTIPEVQEETS